MFKKITPAPGILTAEVIDAELQKQAITYLGILKNIGSKDEFKKRTEEKIVELEEMLEEMREDNNLEMVTNIEEAIKTHKGHLETLDMTNAQYEQDKLDVEEMCEYLRELKENIK